MPKIQPAVQTLFFLIDKDAPQQYIDLSQAASVVNRRFYRQGLNWAVSGFTFIHAAATTGSVVVSKIPNTWMASNAWHKVYAAWKKQQDEAMDDAGGESAIAKFRDFKIALDPIHSAAGAANNLRPQDPTSVPYKQGEWEYSQVVLPQVAPDGTGTLIQPEEFLLHMVGPDIGTSFGMIENYALSRALPHSPTPSHLAVQDNFLSEMFDVGSDSADVVENATNKNDHLPYDQDEYPGGATNAPQPEIVAKCTITATSVGGEANRQGSNFPCGLIRLDPAALSADVGLLVHLVPGNHRGYLAEPMQGM